MVASYSCLVQQYFHDRSRAGVLVPHDGCLLAKGSAGHSNHGERVVIYLLISPSSDKTPPKALKATFKAHGGVATIAACAWATEWLEQKTLPDMLTLTEPLLRQALALPLLKRHSTLLVYSAVQEALAQIGEW